MSKLSDMASSKLSFHFVCYIIILVTICFSTTFASQICEKSAYPPDKKDLVPTYVVNLDLPPMQRWAPLILDKGDKIRELITDVKDVVQYLAGEKIFKILLDGLDSLAATLPYPFYEEIIGIAGYANLPPATITLYNVFYEAVTLCTSIVAQDSNGTIIHGRNLDFGIFLGWDVKNKTWKVAELLHPLAVHLQFKKDGDILFESTSFAGYVGILTAVRKDKFSLSIDKRFSWNGFMGILEWLLFKDHKQHWVSFLTREVMQEAQDYEDAKLILSKSRLLAPVYYILGGVNPGEGCIITRDRDNFDLMNLGSTTNGSGSWYLVQTNYDHWKNPPFYDDRRTPANQCLLEGGEKNVSLGLIYNVLSTKPVLNKESVYTSLMSAKTGEMTSWRRYCPDPCWPW